MTTPSPPRSPSLKQYDLTITVHSRERWMERVVDPERYSHLKTCRLPKCELCNTLLHNIRNIIKNTRKNIDGRIAAKFKEAKEANKKVTDTNFLRVMEKQHGSLSNYDFYWSIDGKYVFMIKKENKEQVLFTIISEDMIDGTVLRDAKSAEAKKQMFDQWKYETRSKTCGNF